MKYVLIILALIATQTLAGNFVPGTEDVPLMSELKECNKETQALFSAPEGRIASVVMSGKAQWKHVVNFYESSLKNLGWELLKTPSSKKVLAFKRNGKEKLTITFIKDTNNILFLRFDFVEG